MSESPSVCLSVCLSAYISVALTVIPTPHTTCTSRLTDDHCACMTAQDDKSPAEAAPYTARVLFVHGCNVPSVRMDRGMTDGELEIFIHARIQTHNVHILYRLFCLLCSVMEPHSLGTPAVQSVSGSQGHSFHFLLVVGEFKPALPLHLDLICVPRYSLQAKHALPYLSDKASPLHALYESRNGMHVWPCE